MQQKESPGSKAGEQGPGPAAPLSARSSLEGEAKKHLDLWLNYLGMAATALGGGLRASWAPKPGLGGHGGYRGLAGQGWQGHCGSNCPLSERPTPLSWFFTTFWASSSSCNYFAPQQQPEKDKIVSKKGFIELTGWFFTSKAPQWKTGIQFKQHINQHFGIDFY